MTCARCPVCNHELPNRPPSFRVWRCKPDRYSPPGQELFVVDHTYTPDEIARVEGLPSFDRWVCDWTEVSK